MLKMQTLHPCVFAEELFIATSEPTSRKPNHKKTRVQRSAGAGFLLSGVVIGQANRMKFTEIS